MLILNIYKNYFTPHLYKKIKDCLDTNAQIY